MATPTKWGNEFLVNTITADYQMEPSITGLADGRFVAMWTDNSHTLGDDSGTAIHAQIFNADGSKAGDEFRANNPTSFSKSGPALTALDDGRFVATWMDYNGTDNDIRMQVFNTDGSRSGPEILVNTLTAGIQIHPDIAALSGGGFAVTWEDRSANDIEIHAQIFDSFGGKLLVDDIVVNTTVANHDFPTITWLTDDSFVVAWACKDANGNSVKFQIHDAAGQKSGGEMPVTQIVSDDQITPDVTTLADGRFVVSWTNEFQNNGNIHGQVFNADGTPSGTEFTANTPPTNSKNPQITALPDGRFALTWVSYGAEQGIHAQLFDADGTRSGSEFVVNTSTDGTAVDPTIAALTDGRFVVTWTENFYLGAGGDGSSSGVRAQIFDPREGAAEIGGSALNDDLVGTGFDDTIKGAGGADHLAGMDGDDILAGGPGADTLAGGGGSDTAAYTSSNSVVTVNLETNANSGGEAQGDILLSIENLVGSRYGDRLTGNADANVIEGGSGSDTIDGRGGDDTAVFSHRFNDHTVLDLGSRIVVGGPDGTDQLAAIEHLRFADTTITPADDGNPLLDTLYYLSRNPDVFQSGVKALDHFNAFGWHEGRNPNVFFDTSEYLSVYRDAAASGLNPLEHYHQSGWQQGHDPSAKFDTRVYLVHNPDVAAAGVDPLQHYLQFGFAEGRHAYAAIGESIFGGFDAEFYLRHNADVAAAGVDPFSHFNTFGWHEGRDPNAWFDTAGYLSHYADVTAAGVNPLEHYQQFGWQEGRDPSGRFDTLGYLAANPDVAAAHVNPLDHFLMFGVYEGRQAVNDGVWH